MFLDPRLCNQREGSISNLKCFLLLFVYSEVNITYTYYYEASQSTVAKQRA